MRFPFLLAVMLVCGVSVHAETLTVAVNRNDQPFAYLDEKGQMTGFSVDLAQALCRAMSVDCRLEPTTFAEFLPGVADGRFDFVVANILRTPEREKTFDFTERLWRSSSAFVGPAGGLAQVDAESARGKTIATQKGSVQERYLNEVFAGIAIIQVHPTNIERAAALAEGRADLMISTLTAAFQFLKSPAGGRFEIIGGPMFEHGLGGEVAIPVRKGRDALRQRLNTALAGILRDGTFARINNTYFPVSVY